VLGDRQAVGINLGHCPPHSPLPTALDPQPQEKQKDASESSELSRLRAELAGALAEMETMKAVAEVSESTKAEAVAAVQRQCQEEVASLQAILKGEAPAPNTTHPTACLPAPL
jgi:hypothetical protein